MRCPHCLHEFDPAVDVVTVSSNPNASCPVVGHEGYTAINCAACRSEYLALPKPPEPVRDRYRTQED